MSDPERRIQVLIEPIRDAARRMVRELGFMQATLAGSGLSPSATHAILEIGAHPSLTASDLSTRLRLEKSSVSRLVQKLLVNGLIAERVDPHDSRVKRLALTAQGRRTLAKINRFARRQVSRALHGLPLASAGLIFDGLQLYADRLAPRSAPPASRPAAATVRIESGYRPGIVGKMIEMQARYYADTARFGREFESTRASDIAGFAARLDRPHHQLWSAVSLDRVVGTIAIDGDTLAPAAYLRWFIVDPAMQGQGIGKRLMRAALAYCRGQGFPEVRLDTFKGLDAARHLYDVAGFTIDRERSTRKWGVELVEQTFVLPLRSHRPRRDQPSGVPVNNGSSSSA